MIILNKLMPHAHLALICGSLIMAIAYTPLTSNVLEALIAGIATVSIFSFLFLFSSLLIFISWLILEEVILLLKKITT